MIRRTSISLALAALLAGATLATAQTGDGGALAPGNDASLRDTPAVDADAARPQLIPGAKNATTGDLGEHQVTGTVSALDPAAGTLVIDVKGKDVRLLFPTTSLSRLEKGDEVTVTVALHKNEAASK